MPQKSDSSDDTVTTPVERRPDVVLDVVFEDGLLFLAVANIGDASALGVHCEFHRELRGLGGTQDVSKLRLFENIAYLGPGREIRTLLDSSAAYFARGEPTEVLVSLPRTPIPPGRSYRSAVKHDLEIYRDLAYVPKGVPKDA
jgi:hypothetical protein